MRESVLADGRSLLRRPSAGSRSRSGSLLREGRPPAAKGGLTITPSIPKFASPIPKGEPAVSDIQTGKTFVLRGDARVEPKSDDNDDDIPLAFSLSSQRHARASVGNTNRLFAAAMPRTASMVSPQGGSRDELKDGSEQATLVPPLGLRQRSASSSPMGSLPTLIEARRVSSHTEIPSLLTTNPSALSMRNSESSGRGTGYTSEPKSKVARLWNRKSMLKIQTHSKPSSPEISAPLPKPNSPFLKSPFVSSPTRSFFSNPLGLRSRRSLNTLNQNSRTHDSIPPSPVMPEIIFDPFRAINNSALRRPSISPPQSPVYSPLIFSSFDSTPYRPAPSPPKSPVFDEEPSTSRPRRHQCRMSLRRS
ncbi:uncharacterized protein EI90DRAFT_897366 [Cantharellus anzutake]|uniref:uncharacterized protein n=1 Tax=Cantharellus anzutake TaxID=1750568 RepID=UPI00190532F5|nr:uncharacterized protein EI90DRAFT_897366 [Cantharellus anzutake]KAF8331885.1 hypothetical protein EI90DRAFT_897366 [Cantharellus anzutake]